MHVNWQKHPWTSFKQVTIRAKPADIDLLLKLFPGCDIYNPPWQEILQELVDQGGYTWDSFNGDDFIAPRLLQLLAQVRMLRTRTLAKSDGNDPPIFLGKGHYQLSDDTHITLCGAEDEVLQALVEIRSGTYEDVRQQSGGHGNPSQVLKRIREKFPALAPYIKLPGTKYSGGYSTTIVHGGRINKP